MVVVVVVVATCTYVCMYVPAYVMLHSWTVGTKWEGAIVMPSSSSCQLAHKERDNMRDVMQTIVHNTLSNPSPLAGQQVGQTRSSGICQ